MNVATVFESSKVTNWFVRSIALHLHNEIGYSEWGESTLHTFSQSECETIMRLFSYVKIEQFRMKKEGNCPSRFVSITNMCRASYKNLWNSHKIVGKRLFRSRFSFKKVGWRVIDFVQHKAIKYMPY
jgi:hypothetical protein